MEVIVNTDKIDFTERRSFGKVITDALRFVKHNFSPLIQSIILSTGLFAAISLMLIGVGYADSFAPAALRTLGVWGGNSIWNSIGFKIGGVVALFFSFVLHNAAISHYIILYKERGPGNFTPGDVAKKAWASIFKYAWAQLWCYIFIGIGFALCFVPSLFVIAMLSAVGIIIANEKMGGFDAINRSWQIIKQDWGTVLGLVIVLYILQFCLQLIVQIPFTVLNEIIGSLSLEERQLDQFENGPINQSDFTLISIVNITLYFIVQLWFYIVSTIYNVAMALKYFDLLEKKEGTYLMQSIESIGTHTNKTDDNLYY